MTTTIQIYGRLGRAPGATDYRGRQGHGDRCDGVDLGRDGEMPEWFSLVAF